MQGIVGKGTHREGRGVGPADDDCPRAFEVGDDRGIARGDVVAERDDAVVGRAAGLVGVDLGRDRHPVQWAERLPPCLHLVRFVGGGQRLPFQDAHHRVDLRVDRLQAREARLYRLPTGNLPEADKPRQLGRVDSPELVRHRAIPRASWSARQTRSGVAGMSMCRMPNSPSASTSAFTTDGNAPAHPASPQPLAPRTLVLAGTG